MYNRRSKGYPYYTIQAILFRLFLREIRKSKFNRMNGLVDHQVLENHKKGLLERR